MCEVMIALPVYKVGKDYCSTVLVINSQINRKIKIPPVFVAFVLVGKQRKRADVSCHFTVLFMFYIQTQ